MNPANRLFLFVYFSFAGLLSGAEFEVVVSPRATVVEREGITGGGHPVQITGGARVFYPNHTDDFGGSVGTGSAHSADGGLTWARGVDDWPIPKAIDLWADRLSNGDLLAMGILWTPDPARRRDVPAQDVPPNAYQMAISKDGGESWTLTTSTIECPAEVGVVARPLPHIIEDKNGVLLMPAYTWSKRGNRSVLLQSDDRGRHWKLRSPITTAVAMIEAGAIVTTPWLETTVSSTQDGDMLAIVRSGSSFKSKLVSVRSTDGGKTWEPPEVLPFPGKLPTLHLLPNGVLTLVTALGNHHCRLYLSEDGTGRSWSDAFVISSLTGSNVGVSIADADKLMITTPANRRIDAWTVRVGPKAMPATGLSPPTNIALSKGSLTWTASPNAVAYRITPLLITPGPAYTDTEPLPYATIQTRDATPKLEPGRQLLPGSVYAFEIAALDRDGKISSVRRSQDFQL